MNLSMNSMSEEKPKRMTLREKEDQQEQEKMEIAQMIYERWKVKKIMATKPMPSEKARMKARAKWSKME